MNIGHSRKWSVFLLLALFISCGHLAYPTNHYQAPFMTVDTDWADTLLSKLSLEEKIGQLFIIESELAISEEHTLELLKEYQPGGVLLKNVKKESYQNILKQLRSEVNIPLLELSDVHTSFNNQIANLQNYPSNASLAAIDDAELNHKLAKKLYQDFQEMGINCSLSPNIQALEKNPTFFQAQQQAQNDLALISEASKRIEDLQERKILAIANALDVYVDSIPDSVLIKTGFLQEYKPLIISGLSGVLMDERIFEGDSIHYRLPSFYKTFLQKHLQFNGLIFGRITAKISLEELLYAGATTVLVSENRFQREMEHLHQLVKDSLIKEEVIDVNVRKILLAKKWLDLDKKKVNKRVNRSPIVLKNQTKEIQYIRSLFEKSIILANNRDSLLPFKDIYHKQFHLIHVGKEKLRTFGNSFFRYANCSMDLYRPQKDGKINALALNQNPFRWNIITISNIQLSAEKHSAFIASIHKINQTNKVVVVNYGNPMNLSLLDSSIVSIQVFDHNKITEDLVPQLLFGGIQAKGKMPIAVCNWIPKATQIKTPIIRMKYALPEEMGISSEKLVGIDSLFKKAIANEATPGGQIVIAKAGKIIYSKVFGHHTYKKKQRVEKTDLYDVASITKTAAATMVAMNLQEKDMIVMKKPLKDQMKLPKKATIQNILLKDLFIHKSGLQSNMPIMRFINNRGAPKDCTPYLCKEKDEEHSLEIAKNFYFNPNYLDSLWLKVNFLPRKYKYRRYLYSDVNFYLVQQLLEEKTEKGLDVYVNEHFYRPLGLRYCTYNPLKRFPADIIVPTQDDKFWRKELVRGYVHDETAALLGGVGGNAGLFANAEDLAVLFQMLLNGGHYGGVQFLEKETIDYFTASTHGNHRGLGFDKAKYSYAASKSVSPDTYGHTGFSGTCVWVDPEEELIYVFLSNRIHPEVRNSRMRKMKLRSKIHQVVYDALPIAKKKILTASVSPEKQDAFQNESEVENERLKSTGMQ